MGCQIADFEKKRNMKVLILSQNIVTYQQVVYRNISVYIYIYILNMYVYVYIYKFHTYHRYSSYSMHFYKPSTFWYAKFAGYT